jgi:hypothetical protein
MFTLGNDNPLGGNLYLDFYMYDTGYDACHQIVLPLQASLTWVMI